jgi:NAD+ synthase (glutamine-hydrolysing)
VWEQGLMAVDLDLPRGLSDLAGDVDAKDGTTMHVDRVVLSAEPLEAYTPITPGIAPPLSDEAAVWGALVTATRDYVEKNGFASVALGLSGGIDSAVVATLACDALGGDRVHVIGMPSAWSSDGSITDALELATLQGLHWQQIPIAPMVDAYCAATPLTGLALENLQARVRGTLLMALSNQHGHLILTTGNKSELATGFSTLYGDSAGGFAPIKDVPKSLVWALARWRNTQSYVIPTDSIEKPPSAELAPGQLDSDRLPDYTVLDALLEAYIGRDLGRAELIAAGFDAALVDRVVRLVDLAEYKRRQNPPGPKITSRAFGRDRRLPITSKWRES